MRHTDPLSRLIEHVQRKEFRAPHARLLVDEDGLVRQIAPNEVVPERALLRFDVIPPDQIVLGYGEFLVRAMFCKYAKGQTAAIPMNKSFMFKILPGELAEDTVQRIGSYRYFRSALLPLVNLRTTQRILNGDEALDAVVAPDDVLMIVLPHRLKAAAIVRKAGGDAESADLLYEMGDAD
jgi:hypothetical protein